MRDTCRHLTANDINHPCLSVAQHHPHPQRQTCVCHFRVEWIAPEKAHRSHLSERRLWSQENSAHLPNLCIMEISPGVFHFLLLAAK